MSFIIEVCKSLSYHFINRLILANILTSFVDSIIRYNGAEPRGMK